jgi:CarD family transcriptional regulator
VSTAKKSTKSTVPAKSVSSAKIAPSAKAGSAAKAGAAVKVGIVAKPKPTEKKPSPKSSSAARASAVVKSTAAAKLAASKVAALTPVRTAAKLGSISKPAARLLAKRAAAAEKPAPNHGQAHGHVHGHGHNHHHRGKTPPSKPLDTGEKKKPVTRSDAHFKVGEMVVYPFHGVGIVKGLEKLNITGDEKWYYTLDFRNGELTVKLPVEQQDEKGMRRVVGKADVEKIMTILRKKPPSEESDWKVRYNLYLEKLKSGDIYEAAKVARNLSKRGPEGELSMSEKRLLEASVQLLVHEIATASREPIEKVEGEINKCLRAGRA